LTSFPYRTGDAASPGEIRFQTELEEDIVRSKAALVIIRVGKPCQACPSGFSEYEYLSRTGWIDRALKNYSKIGWMPDCVIFRRVKESSE
jgi:hypothetical protein